MEIEIGDFSFSSNFDSGNLQKVVRAHENDIYILEGIVDIISPSVHYPRPDFIFHLWTKPDGAGTVFENGNRTWFHFAVKCPYPACYIQFNVMNMNKQTRLFSQGMAPVYCIKPSHPEYIRIPQKPHYKVYNGNFVVSFIHKMPSDSSSTTYFAFTFPYPYEKLQKYLDELERRFHYCKKVTLESAKCHDIYFWRENLCYSLERRRVDLLTITSFHGMTTQREPYLSCLLPDKGPRPFHFTGKKVFFISSRVHPGETPASFVMEGFLEFILKEGDWRASQLRKLYVFKVVPMLNPDGVALGYYRSDSRGMNLNRVYRDPIFELHPSIFAVKSIVLFHHITSRQSTSKQDILSNEKYNGNSIKTGSLKISGPNYQQQPTYRMSDPVSSKNEIKNDLTVSKSGNSLDLPSTTAESSQSSASENPLQSYGNSVGGHPTQSESDSELILKAGSSKNTAILSQTGKCICKTLKSSTFNDDLQNFFLSAHSDTNLKSHFDNKTELLPLLTTGIVCPSCIRKEKELSLNKTAHQLNLACKDISYKVSDIVNFNKDDSSFVHKDECSTELIKDICSSASDVDDDISEHPFNSEKEDFVDDGTDAVLSNSVPSELLSVNSESSAIIASLDASKSTSKGPCDSHYFSSNFRTIESLAAAHTVSKGYSVSEENKHKTFDIEETKAQLRTSLLTTNSKNSESHSSYPMPNSVVLQTEMSSVWDNKTTLFLLNKLKTSEPEKDSSQVLTSSCYMTEQKVTESPATPSTSCDSSTRIENSDSNCTTNIGDGQTVNEELLPVASNQEIDAENDSPETKDTDESDELKNLVGTHLRVPEFASQIPSCRSGIAFYVDLHGHVSKKGCFMYGNYFEDLEDMIDCMLLPKLLSVNCNYFDFRGCNFSEKNMYSCDKRDGLSKEGSGRVSLHRMTGITRSYTLECNYNTGYLAKNEKALQSYRKIVYTPAVYKEVGQVLALSLLDIEGINDTKTLLAKSEFRSLHGLRESLRRHIKLISHQSMRIQSSTFLPTSSNALFNAALQGNRQAIQIFGRLEKRIRRWEETGMMDSIVIRPLNSIYESAEITAKKLEDKVPCRSANSVKFPSLVQMSSYTPIPFLPCYRFWKSAKVRTRNVHSGRHSAGLANKKTVFLNVQARIQNRPTKPTKLCQSSVHRKWDINGRRIPAQRKNSTTSNTSVRCDDKQNEIKSEDNDGCFSNLAERTVESFETKPKEQTSALYDVPTTELFTDSKFQLSKELHSLQHIGQSPLSIQPNNSSLNKFTGTRPKVPKEMQLRINQPIEGNSNGLQVIYDSKVTSSDSQDSTPNHEIKSTLDQNGEISIFYDDEGKMHMYPTDLCIGREGKHNEMNYSDTSKLKQQLFNKSSKLNKNCQRKSIRSSSGKQKPMKVKSFVATAHSAPLRKPPKLMLKNSDTRLFCNSKNKKSRLKKQNNYQSKSTSGFHKKESRCSGNFTLIGLCSNVPNKIRNAFCQKKKPSKTISQKNLTNTKGFKSSSLPRDSKPPTEGLMQGHYNEVLAPKKINYSNNKKSTTSLTKQRSCPQLKGKRDSFKKGKENATIYPLAKTLRGHSAGYDSHLELRKCIEDEEKELSDRMIGKGDCHFLHGLEYGMKSSEANPLPRMQNFQSSALHNESTSLSKKTIKQGTAKHSTEQFQPRFSIKRNTYPTKTLPVNFFVTKSSPEKTLNSPVASKKKIDSTVKSKTGKLPKRIYNDKTTSSSSNESGDPLLSPKSPKENEFPLSIDKKCSGSGNGRDPGLAYLKSLERAHQGQDFLDTDAHRKHKWRRKLD